MPSSKITTAQLTRLQVLWGQYARRDMIKNSREERLRWANEELYHLSASGDSARPHFIESFKELSLSQASDLINILQGILGIKETSPAVSPRRFRSRIKNREEAHAAGTEGRRGSRTNFTVASTENLAMLDMKLTSMGWTRARLEAFLQSPSSPLRGRSEIRTVGDINRVLWALKRIDERQAKQGVQN